MTYLMKLYHFTKANTAIKNILPNMELRMNTLGEMDDPKENLLHIINADRYLIKQQYSWHTEVIAKIIREGTQVLSFSLDSFDDNNQPINFGYEKQRMWVQYGEKNMGVCIVLNHEVFLKENEVIIKKYHLINNKVVYSTSLFGDILPPLSGTSPKNNNRLKTHTASEHWKELQKNKQFVNERFFTKNFDWAGETEYRLLAFDVQNKNLHLSIRESFDKIILGPFISETDFCNINKIVPTGKIHFLILTNGGDLVLIPSKPNN